MRRFFCVVFSGLVLLFSGCSDSLLGDFFSGKEITGDNVDEVIHEGLEAWRKRGAILDGAACANCHAPDALDLAYFDFPEKTIRRRSQIHIGIGSGTLSKGKVNKIVNMVKALRIKYDIKPRDHMKDRPFQPGGEVLPGNTPAERDRAFGNYLVERGFRFATVPVLDKEEALRQRDEWLAINPREIKIGIPLNRWSEDPFHGTEHATMADWLPDSPRVPKRGRAKDWYRFHDAYLKNPTDENFWKMYNQIKNLTRPDFIGNSDRFFGEKYRAALVAQHLFRKRLTGGKPLSEQPSTVFMPSAGKQKDNPVWDVATIAHVLRHGDLRDEDFEMPAAIAKENSNLVEQMRQIRVPWFYAGWLLDQGLQHSGEGENTETGRYFTLHMHIDNGYALHNIFAITRKLVVQNFDEKTQDTSLPLVVNYENFSNYDYEKKYEPQKKGAQQIYRLITENSFRMMLFLIQDEIEKNGLPADSNIVDNWLEAIKDFKSFAEYAHTDHYAFNSELASETQHIIESKP